MTEEKDMDAYKKMAQYILPEVIYRSFDLVRVEKQTSEGGLEVLHLYVDEKPVALENRKNLHSNRTPRSPTSTPKSSFLSQYKPLQVFVNTCTGFYRDAVALRSGRPYVEAETPLR